MPTLQSQNNFLEYLRVKSCLKSFLAKFTVKNLSYERPILPPYLKLLVSPNRGSRHFYEILNQQYDNIKLKTKWNTTLNIDIDTDDWQNVYKVCFKTLKRNLFGFNIESVTEYWVQELYFTK